MDAPEAHPAVPEISDANDPRRLVRDIPLLCIALQIAPQQAKLLSLLLVSRIVTPVMAYEDFGCSDVHVAVHRLRQRVQRPFGIHVYNQRGVGYALKAEMRTRTLEVLSSFAISSEFAIDVA